MASSGDVAILNTVHTPFGKIHKLYRTANQKIVKNDVTEIKIEPPEQIQVRVRVTAEYQMIESPPPLPTPQKKKLKWKKHKGGPERRNNLVPSRNQTKLQPTPPPNLGRLVIGWTPPIDWYVNAYLLYFKYAFKTVEQNIWIKTAVDDCSKLSSLVDYLAQAIHPNLTASSI